MRVENINNNRLYFRSVRLSEKELKKTDLIINQILSAKTRTAKTENLYRQLFDLFFPHIEAESKLRAGRFYIQEEVFSEIALNLAEILNNLTSKTKAVDIVGGINDYKPSKYAYKPEILTVSLSNYKYRNNTDIREEDLITEDDLPVPESKITIERYHKIIGAIIEKSSLSELQRKRLTARSRGLTVKAISEEENVSTQVVKSAINKSILKIQNKSGSLPVKITKKIEYLSDFLGCSYESLKKTILIRPDLLYYKPETLKKNLENSSKAFGCSYDKFLKMALKQPALFYQKTETLQKNIQKSAKILNCAQEDFIKASLRLPELFCRNAESLKNNIIGSAALLKCSEKELTTSALKHPQIFCKKPEILYNNAKMFSELFNIPFDDSVKIMMKYPALFYRDLKKIHERVPQNAQLLNIEESVFLKTALKSPILLCLNPEKILKNYNIMNYYRKMQNVQSQSLLPILSDEMWYAKMLTNLINKKENSNVIIAKNVSTADLERYLQNNTDKTYSFEIPEGFAAKDLTDYADKLSNKILGKNIFDIKIIEQTKACG